MAADSSPSINRFPKTTAQVHTLENGLELIIKQDRRAPVVSLQFWVGTGSIHERDWLGGGLSHFLEHMLFKGSENYSAQEIVQEVQSQGAYINAYTTFDRTVYWIDSPKEGAEPCLKLLCDMVARCCLPDEDFVSEAEVIRREIAMGEDNPEQVLSKALFEEMFIDHPAKYPIIGYQDVFDQLKIEDLRSYYEQTYRPDQTTVVVVGDIDPDAVKELVSQELENWKRSARPRAMMPSPIPLRGRRTRTLRFPTDLARVRYSWSIPPGEHEDAAALDIVSAILGEGRTSRLYRRVREELGLAHSVSAYAYTPSFAGIFGVGFDCDPDRRTDAADAVLAVLHDFLEHGVTESELKRVKNRTLASQISTLASMRGQASDLASNWTSVRNLDFTRDYVAEVEALTCDDVLAVARKYLRVDDFLETCMLPEIDMESGEPVEGVVNEESGGEKLVVLENGLKVLLCPDRSLPVISADLYFRGGVIADHNQTSGAMQLLSRLTAKDTQFRSAEEFAERIESVGGGVNAKCGNHTFGLSSHALSEHGDLVIGTVFEGLLENKIVPQVFEKEREFQKAQILAEEDRPFSVAFKELRRMMFGDHPLSLSLSGTAEGLDAVSISSLDALRSALLNPKEGICLIAGDFQEADVLDQLRAIEFPAGERGRDIFQVARDRQSELPPLTGEVRTIHHAILLIGYRTPDLFDKETGLALDFIDEACGDMASRLFVRIREELGLAYSVGTTRIPSVVPGLFLFYVMTDPARLELAQDEMLSVIQSIADSGFSDEEMQRTQAAWVGREAFQNQTARQRGEGMAIDELVGLGKDHADESRAALSDLTSEDVQRVARDIFNPANSAIVRLTDTSVIQE